MSNQNHQIDARIVQTIRRLKVSNKAGTVRVSSEKDRKPVVKPYTSSSSTIRKMNIYKVNENNHPGTANKKILIEANTSMNELLKLDELKEIKAKYFEKYKNLCVLVVLNDKDCLKLWKTYFDNLDIIFIENWLKKYLFQKNFFLFKLQETERELQENKFIENDDNNITKNNEINEDDNDIKNLIKYEIIKVLESTNLDTKIDKKLSDLQADFQEYITKLNNFSYD